MDTSVVKVVENLNSIIEMFKNMAPEVWNIVVRQYIIFGTIDAVIGISSVITAVAVWTVIYRSENRERPVLVVLGVITTTGGIITSIFAAMYLSNPEYWALMDLIS